MSSFKQMRQSGELVRADAEKIDYFSIHIEPGFNPAGRTEQDDEDDEALYQFICDKGIYALPQWEVRPRDEGGVWAVDCHRRHKQTGRAIANGKLTPDAKTGLYLIPIRQFVGNDLDRLYRVKTSNSNKKLTHMQFAELCQRAHHGFGQSVAEIAKGMQCAASAVETALALASADHSVQQMVKAGEIAPTTVAKVVKAEGEKAGAVLQQAQQTARLNGKKKITAKSIEGNTPADLVKAIEQDMASGGSFKAEDLAPKYAALIAYLRGTAKP